MEELLARCNVDVTVIPGRLTACFTCRNLMQSCDCCLNNSKKITELCHCVFNENDSILPKKTFHCFHFLFLYSINIIVRNSVLLRK